MMKEPHALELSNLIRAGKCEDISENVLTMMLIQLDLQASNGGPRLTDGHSEARRFPIGGDGLVILELILSFVFCHRIGSCAALSIVVDILVEIMHSFSRLALFVASWIDTLVSAISVGEQMRDAQ